MCKHVSVLQIAQQDLKVQKMRKKNFLVNNVRKLTAARESWHYFFSRHSFEYLICEFQNSYHVVELQQVKFMIKALE